VGEPVELTVVLVSPDRDLYSDADEISLRSRRRARTPDGGLPEGAEVRWLRVVPRLYHVDTPSPNPGNPSFSNTVIRGPDHGDWLGYDQLEYETRPLVASSMAEVHGPHLTVTGALATRPQENYQGAGSNWFAAEVVLADGTIVRTPDGDDVDRHGLVSEVQRVSFRSGDDYLGWLSTYFNVPKLFGSTGSSDRRHQTEQYIGADCADVLVGALRAGGVDDASYTSISGIHHLARPVTDALLLDELGQVRELTGEPRPLRWGEDIEPGDLLVLNYESLPEGLLPRDWDHIGALVSDSGPDGTSNGVLDSADVMRHMTRIGLIDRPLYQLGELRFRIYRWRDWE
jgi:hypothetical protein